MKTGEVRFYLEDGKVTGAYLTPHMGRANMITAIAILKSVLGEDANVTIVIESGEEIEC